MRSFSPSASSVHHRRRQAGPAARLVDRESRPPSPSPPLPRRATTTTQSPVMSIHNINQFCFRVPHADIWTKPKALPHSEAHRRRRLVELSSAAPRVPVTRADELLSSRRTSHHADSSRPLADLASIVSPQPVSLLSLVLPPPRPRAACAPSTRVPDAKLVNPFSATV